MRILSALAILFILWHPGGAVGIFPLCHHLLYSAKHSAWVGYEHDGIVGPEGKSQVLEYDMAYCVLEPTRKLLVPSNLESMYNSPRAILVVDRELYVVYANAGNRTISGGILAFDKHTGNFKREVIVTNSTDAPWSPRGAILYGGRGRGRRPGTRFLIVADGGNRLEVPNGSLKKYSLDGEYLGNIPQGGLKFSPRTLVVGPDGKLYVTSGNLHQTGRDVGLITRFDVTSGFEKILSSNTGTSDCDRLLHRPEGIVFGPDKRMYVTTFVKDSEVNTTIDGILIYSSSGECVDNFPWRPPNIFGNRRVFAQTILFGPQGYLYAPMSSNGEIRRYDTRTWTYSVVAPGFYVYSSIFPINETATTPDYRLIPPYYMFFDQTDPSTLNYNRFNS